ncbi:MAG: hypothetical protein WD228_12445 [Mycobacterium sp.]
MRTCSHPRDRWLVVAPEIGEDGVQTIEMGSHDVQSCGQLFAFSFQICTLAKHFADSRPGGSPALPVDVTDLAVEFIEFGRKAAKQLGQPIPIALDPVQPASECGFGKFHAVCREG